MGLLSLVFVAVLVAFGPIFGGEKLTITAEQVDGKKRLCVRAFVDARTRAFVGVSRESA